MFPILKSIKNRFVSLKRSVRFFILAIKRTFVAPVLPADANGFVAVNLGCGENTSAEFINIDTRKLPAIHYIHEVQHLPMLRNDSVDLLYASHLVEHIPRGELSETFKEWYRVLKPGGVLRIGVPHFENLIEIYKLSGNDVHSIENQLLGQNAPYDDHHTIWNRKFAEEVFMTAGFKQVREWSPESAEHHSFKDKSDRAIDIAGKKISVSLNVEGIK